MTDRPNDQYMATTDEAASGGAHIGDEEPIFTDSGSSRVQGSVASVNKISSTSKFCRQSPLFADPEDNVPTGAPLPWNGNLHLAQERSLLHLPNSPFPARQAPNSPGLSNIRQLRFFLESRQVAVGEEMPSKLTDNSQVEVLQHDATGPVTTTSDDPTATPKIPEATIPLDIRSESIVLPSDWNVPTEAHHYVASLSLLQRRALVQCMQEDCNILLTEISDSTGPELIIDSHSAVISFTLSEVVPSNVAKLAAFIVNLAYSFSRILVVLESYPRSRANDSLEKNRRRQSGYLRMMTETVASACTRLKRNVAIRIGTIGADVDAEDNNGFEIGEVSVDYVLADSVEETARLVRVFADSAEASVSEWERKKLWGPRPWLEAAVRNPRHPSTSDLTL